MAMNDFLIESGNRANRPTLLNNLMSSKYEEDIKTMAELADNRKLNSLVNQLIADDKLMPSYPRTKGKSYG